MIDSIGSMMSRVDPRMRLTRSAAARFSGDAPPTPEELKQLEEEEKAANQNATVNANDEETEDETAN